MQGVSSGEALTQISGKWSWLNALTYNLDGIKVIPLGLAISNVFGLTIPNVFTYLYTISSQTIFRKKVIF